MFACAKRDEISKSIIIEKVFEFALKREQPGLFSSIRLESMMELI